jgi:hypothetical protein
MARSIFVEKTRAALKSYCKYKFRMVHRGEECIWIEDELGCQEIVPLESRSQHEENCLHAFTTCKFSSICGFLRKKDLPTHLSECLFRMVSCELCDKEVQFSALDAHYKKCPLYPIPCRRCQVQVPRKNIESHLRNDCLEEVVPCICADAGCSIEVCPSLLFSPFQTTNFASLLLALAPTQVDARSSPGINARTCIVIM